MSFKQECIRAAGLIAERATALGRTPVLLLSGGLDSEAMTRAFIDSGVPFRVSSFTYPNGILAHETQFIDKFVARHGLHHTYVFRDWLHWLETPAAKQMFIESGSVFTSCVPHIELMRLIWEDGGFPVVGTGDASIERADEQWLFVNRENLRTPLLRYLDRKGMDGVVLFYQYTPELVASFLLEPRIQRAMCSDLAAKLLPNLSSVKYDIYRHRWPDLGPRMKLTQYERHPKLYRRLDVEYAAGREVLYNDTWTRPVPLLLAHLTAALPCSK